MVNTQLKKDENNSSKPHILMVDDDKRIRTLVSRYLHEHGFIVLSAHDASEASKIMEMFDFDALVVDVMMPGQTGFEFTKLLREENENVPVLLLTALGEVDDRIEGLECGADDYLAKPFEPKELVLRLSAILRRTQKRQEETGFYRIGAWVFDPAHDELVAGQEHLKLTSVEANLLRALVHSLGIAVSREELAERCNLDAGERTIDVQVTRLRKKIEENTKTPRYLQTIRGKGYMLRAEHV